MISFVFIYHSEFNTHGHAFDQIRLLSKKLCCNQYKGNSTGIPKLDQKIFSSATNENNFFSLILLKYIHMTIC